MNIECLEKLINIYKEKNYSCYDKLWKNFIRRQSSYEETVIKAVMGIDQNNKLHPHLYRISKISLVKAKNLLLEMISELKKCTSFEDILKITEDVKSRVKGYGALSSYDAAVKIGYFKNIEPEKVYLHCGTYYGAKALGINVWGKSYLDIKDLPKPLQKLSASDLENFFCVMKTELVYCK